MCFCLFSRRAGNFLFLALLYCCVYYFYRKNTEYSDFHTYFVRFFRCMYAAIYMQLYAAASMRGEVIYFTRRSYMPDNNINKFCIYCFTIQLFVKIRLLKRRKDKRKAVGRLHSPYLRVIACILEITYYSRPIRTLSERFFCVPLRALFRFS